MEFRNKEQEALFETYSSQVGKEYIELGEKIKALDKSNDKKMLAIKLVSIISLGILGFFAFGNLGAIIFIMIAFISSFALQLSSKKNIMLRYFTFYRTRIPRLIAESQGVMLEVKEPDSQEKDFIASLYERYTLSFRTCHRYGELYIGFAKFMEKNEPAVQGVLYYTPENKISDEGKEELKSILNKELDNGAFSDYIFKVADRGSLLYLIGADEYLNGKVEMKNDLTFEAISRQLDFYMIGKKLEELSK